MNDMLELLVPPEEVAVQEELKQARSLLALLADPAVRQAEAEARLCASSNSYQQMMKALIPLQEMPLPTASVFYGHLCSSTFETPKTLPPSDEGLMTAS